MSFEKPGSGDKKEEKMTRRGFLAGLFSSDESKEAKTSPATADPKASDMTRRDFLAGKWFEDAPAAETPDPRSDRCKTGL